MTTLTVAQVKPAGTTEIVICELCHQKFEFTHNGEWLPAACPKCTDILMMHKEQAINLYAIYEQIERCAWLNYYLNLWQLPQLDPIFCEQTCRRYCPDWTPETARQVFRRENKKLAEMQEADRNRPR